MVDYSPPPPFFSSPSPFNHQIRESAADKAYDAEWKWLSSSEAKQRSKAAKAVALSDFKKRFPQADMSKFQVQVDFDANRKAVGGGCYSHLATARGRTLSSKTKCTGRSPLKQLWGCHKTVASQPSCRQCNNITTSRYQSRRLTSLQPQGRVSLISLTRR